jgi:sugar-specific transcriptional regulator TrmB
MKNQAAQSLTFLGFSEIEALIYCFLLEESPATGYRISHAIGKPTANTYKAIAALAQRGAVILDDSEKSLCRAVPYPELLDALGRDFEDRKRSAQAELARIKIASGDDRVYQLSSVEQLQERARSMITKASRAVLLDAFPTPLSWLAAELVAAAKRGVRVAVRAYQPTALKGIIVAVANDASRVVSVWPGEQLSIAMDGEQFLTALIAKDGEQLHQAIWSNSTFLSCMQFNALHSELVMTDMLARGDVGPSVLEGLSLTRLKPPGFLKLNDRYGEASKPDARVHKTKGP